MKNIKIFRWIGLFIQCLLGVLLLWWIGSHSDLDSAQFIQRLSQASLLPLILGVTCFALTIFIGALRYYVFLPASTSIIYLFGTTLLQNALLTFMPWRTGEVSYPLLLRRDYNIPLSSSSAVILTIRLVDLLIILIVALVSGAKLGLDIRWIGVVLGVALVLGICALIGLKAWSDKGPTLIRTLVSAVTPLYDPRRLASFTALSVAVFVLSTLQSVFILRSMAFDVKLLDIASLNALTLLIALLPIHPPGGWGTMDSIQVVILERLGYSSKLALVAILAAHTFYTGLIFVGGFIGWLIRGKNRPVVRAIS